MKILAMEREVPGVKPDDFKPHLKAEAIKVWELYQAGFLREIYFHADQFNAILILESKNAEDATKVLNALPLVKEGLITFEIIPLIPYPGFARLFSETV